jgi:hypothetical protein
MSASTYQPTEAEIKLANENFFAKLDGGHVKQAVDGVNDYTRTKMREDGFVRQIIEPLTVSNDQLDRQQHTSEPVKIIDFEPDSPAAISVPFGALPYNVYIRGNRYAVTFCRLMTPRFVADIGQLRTWVMDIRQVLSDNSVKDMLAEEDTQFINAVNVLMGGPNVELPFNGNKPMWEEIEASISRASWEDARKIMPRGKARLEATTALLNNITIKEFEKFGRDEMGGDLSQDVLKNGWAETTLSKVRLIITIKHEIVPEDSVFFFAETKFLGKNFLLEDTTMYVKAEFFMIEFFTYQCIGQSVVGGTARADFV